MRIAHVLHLFPSEPAGGTERTVLALAKAMQTAGHEVVIVAGSLDVGPSHTTEEEVVQGLRVIRIRREDLWFESWEKAWSPAVGDAFAKVLDALRPDVVHVHHWIRMTTDLVRIARRRAGTVVACTLNDYWTQLATPTREIGVDVPAPPSRARWVNASEADEAFALHRADLLDEVRAAHLRFVPSLAHARGLAEMARADLGPLLAAPPPLLAVPPRRAPRSGPRGRTLLFFGSIYAEKGLDVAIGALASVGGWRLIVLGEIHDPVQRDRLHARCARLPIEFRGRFTAEQLAAVEADYALIPSTSHESYGLVVDEARCLGLPLIASDLPAYREHADPDATAFFAAGDPGSLAVLLLDEVRLATLREPRAHWVGAQQAAEQLLVRYAEAVRGEHRPCGEAPLCNDARRAAVLFRRAERRLWSLLQDGEPKLPPDAFLGGDA